MLKRLEIAGFKSFARKTVLDFSSSVTAIVGPNGSGKSNVAEAFRFALGEQSMKSMRGKRSEDLIFAGSQSTGRQNRASVAVVFDNSRKQFKLDFEEIQIERAVFRDGSSEYSINGSKARLRDIQELLASSNIGETGHHIISQGEADRILLANTRERREMLEDALGLTSYEFRKEESSRKLEKTEENIRQVEALRRELSPHLKFLSSQVQKLERADELRKSLESMAAEYLAIEEGYLAEEKGKMEGAAKAGEERLKAVAHELASLGEGSEIEKEGIRKAEKVRETEREVDRILSERSALSRELGKIEGALESAKRRSQAAARDPYAKIPRDELVVLRDEIDKRSKEGGDSVEGLRAALGAVAGAIRAFFERYAVGGDAYLHDEEQAALALAGDHERLIAKDKQLGEALEEARMRLAKAREASVAFEEGAREGTHRMVELAQEKAKLEGEVERAHGRIRELALLADELDRDRAEIAVLVGKVISYVPAAAAHEERSAQEARKKALERAKIRLEEAGGTGEDVRHEFKEATEREQFLSRELEDLSRSAEGLKQLIKELDVELAKNFTEGLKKVNDSFGEFFALMFGGGSAKLVLEEPNQETDDEDEENEGAPRVKRDAKAGVDIAVHLPKKRVQALMQLSGGERALTSIALIFAMSQVNPPPFLILDETDAALDEANSRRYGDMIESLAKRSQLIVITHNRETMSRAGILYGVTMGGDGISKLLSVKFDEAAAVAK
ncbi:MAG: AAA family ATPase [Candidatus Pacebacteria bacterium]|nr:AAA family ATPase [Candidatus Paceibacterota bacterium]MBP9840692.1 AAA family ATPase [Candidatus Paceibacterota bacterium]